MNVAGLSHLMRVVKAAACGFFFSSFLSAHACLLPAFSSLSHLDLDEERGATRGHSSSLGSKHSQRFCCDSACVRVRACVCTAASSGRYF